MKLRLLALLGVLFLAACSDSGSGGQKGIGPDDFNPQAVPANPAPKAYVQKTFGEIEKSKIFHPQDAAIFSEIIDGTDVKQIDTWAQNQALQSLDPAGRALVDRIKQNCTLNPAQKTKTGNASSFVEKLGLSAQGAGCNFKITKTVEQNTQQSSSEDQNTGSMSFSGVVRNVQKESRELNDITVQSLTGLISVVQEINTTATINFKGHGKTGEQNLDIAGTAMGSISYNLINNETVKGPITLWMSIKSSTDAQGKTTETLDMRTKFDLKSPQGDIVIILLITEQGARAYLNGEEIDPSVVHTTGTVETLYKAKQLFNVSL